MDDLIPWFALKNISGIGNLIFKRLIDRFGNPESVFKASFGELRKVKGLTDTATRCICGYKGNSAAQKEIERIIRLGYKIITIKDLAYPPLLREIPDPPPLLYYYGDLKPSIAMLAVVGSRNATSYGLSTTSRLCKELAGFDITIVSGMAKGIDSAAHYGAIKGGGKTIAVMGSGLNVIYPAENRGLFKKISENGAVISELPLDTKPEPHNFPARNRIISGMSIGTVVVEAAKKSGSLITAHLAAEQGREVFAVPGSINSFKSAGTHALIRQGAKLIDSVNDIIEDISHLIKADVKDYEIIKKETISPDKKQIRKDISIDELPVYQALSDTPIHIDDLARKLSMDTGDTGRLLSILLQLEIKELIVQVPGKLFLRRV